MDLYHCTIISISLLLQIISCLSKETISCYSCDSRKSADCAELEHRKLKQFVKVCKENAVVSTISKKIDEFIPRSFKPNTLLNLDKVCVKAELSDEGSKKKVVIRDCMKKSDECYDLIKEKIPSIAKNIQDFSCKPCDVDLCNNSSITSPAAFILLVVSFFTCFLLLN
ncbi:uncharacterized protein LOC111064136 [Nilaparvata lugens]|uniref:uncharacterized protein LOC111064136 n=1 Tax=Nilaparvata lugens TaxID=108931 RepID=UPI00193E27DB|nr:uncharacterized protein LOC111064136 [Nilaparvata lugens]